MSNYYEKLTKEESKRIQKQLQAEPHIFDVQVIIGDGRYVGAKFEKNGLIGRIEIHDTEEVDFDLDSMEEPV